MQNAQKINEALREVCNVYLGATVILTERGPLARSHKQAVRGEIVQVTTLGFLIQHPHSAGREYINFTDVYAGHVQIVGPSEMAQNIDDALVRLGVGAHRNMGRTGIPVLPVGPSADGVKRAKRLIG